jgi:hypothetical protein
MIREHLSETPQEAAQRRAVVPGMAHFAGSGPRGSTCAQCDFQMTTKKAGESLCAKVAASKRVPFPSSSAVCNKFAEVRRG